MDFYTPKFDENGHMRESLPDNPSYVDLLNMLNDCVGLLNKINIDNELLETYANVLMNAENILLSAATHYELNQRKADEIVEDL